MQSNKDRMLGINVTNSQEKDVALQFSYYKGRHDGIMSVFLERNRCLKGGKNE